MKYKRSRDELEPGDKVVYVFPGYAGSPNAAYEVEVVRTSKTRIVVVNPEKHVEESFLRSSGRMVGYSDSRYSNTIEVGKWAEHALKKGRENMMRSEVLSLLRKVEEAVKNSKIPLPLVYPLLRDALEIVNKAGE